MVEQRVQRQCDVGGIFSRRILKLQTRRERQPHQRLLPFVGQRRVITITTPQHDPTELRDDAQGVFQNLWCGVIAIDEDGDAGFGRRRMEHDSMFSGGCLD